MVHISLPSHSRVQYNICVIVIVIVIYNITAASNKYREYLSSLGRNQPLRCGADLLDCLFVLFHFTILSENLFVIKKHKTKNPKNNMSIYKFVF